MPRYRDELWIPTVAEALDRHLRVGALKKLAAVLSAGPLPTRKAELVALLLGHLEGERLRALWERLDELERAAVAEVVRAPGTRFEQERFRAKYGRDPDWGSLSEYDRAARPSLLHLFFYARVMPDDLKERLAAFVPAPAEAALASAAELPAVLEQGQAAIPLAVRETERAAQRDLLAVLRLVEAGRISVSDKTRRPGGPAIRAVAAVLDGGDFYEREAQPPEWDGGDPVGPIRAFAWPLLVQAGGLAELAGSRLRLTKAGAKALGEPPAATIRTIWRRWLEATLLDELSRVEAIKGQTGKGRRGLTAVAGRRFALACALADCSLGGWVETDELFRYMRAAGHDFEVTRDAWRLYICEPHYGSLGYDGYGGWDILQTRYALCLLFEYASTLGLVDVAYVPPEGARPDYRKLWGTDGLPFLSRYDGLAYVRLTSLGAYCLGLADEYAPPPLERRPVLRVLPNLEVAATGGELAFADRLALDRYAEKISDRVWRLELATLLAALERGGSVAELEELLSARSVDPLPEAVRRLLADVAGRGRSLVDRGPARLVECADPALAVLLTNDARTRGLCLPAGERHVVVPAASEPAFRRGLRKLGYTLAVSEQEPAVAA